MYSSKNQTCRNTSEFEIRIRLAGTLPQTLRRGLSEDGEITNICHRARPLYRSREQGSKRRAEWNRKFGGTEWDNGERGEMKSLIKKSVRRPKRVESKRSAPPQNNKDSAVQRNSISIFETPLGWIGLVGQDEKLISVFAGYPSLKSVKTAATKAHQTIVELNWNPTLRQLFEDYATGEAVDFSQVEIELPVMTAFQQQVIAVTRQVGYGQTISYGELARRAGYPRAARAVGTVMSTNRFPILIPCHRVLAAGGKLGGYSSPAGITLKERLLELEGRNEAMVSRRPMLSWKSRDVK